MSVAIPNGPTDTYVYNGLGLRVGKTDSTGSYSYICDGTSPGSPVLSDGHTLYTPGLSENKGGVPRYYSNDRLGNLWTLDGSSKNQLFYEDNVGFGGLFAEAGSGSVFGFGGGNGCQTDVDTGLVLMGHRYYDTRIGRFITQDPTHFGGNWYAYADNSPTREVDPLGLRGALTGSLNLPGSWSDQQVEDYVALNYDDGTYSATKNGVTRSFTINTFQNIGGIMMQVPPHQDFNSMLSAARNFANNINAKEAALATHGPTGVLKATLTAALEAEKAKWYVDHFENGTIGDPKHWNMKFENFGNFQAGGAADVMGYALGPYLLGVQAEHMKSNPFGPLGPFENLDLTSAGYGYAQARYGN